MNLPFRFCDAVFIGEVIWTLVAPHFFTRSSFLCLAVEYYAQWLSFTKRTVENLQNLYPASVFFQFVIVNFHLKQDEEKEM